MTSTEVSRNVTAYSETTGITYPTWEALVEAEANGWVAVAVITEGKQVWPWVVGPYPDKADAVRAQARLRTRWRREQSTPFRPKQTAKFYVRPSWKTTA